MKVRSRLGLVALCSAVGFAAAAGCSDGDMDSLRGKSNGTDSPAASPPPAVEDATSSDPLRLTRREYDNVVRDLLGDTTQPSQTRLPADTRTPFDNAFTGQDVSPALIEGAELLAEEVSKRFLEKGAARDATVGCVPTGPGDTACLKGFVERFGRRILRGPMAADEVDDFVATAGHIAVAENDFYAAVDVVLRAFLQHPRFLYRLEVGESVEGRPDVRRLTDWEVATKLSFSLWGTTPDDALLKKAETKQLRTVEEVRAAAKEMLADPRAQELVSAMHAMWLQYEGLAWDPVLAPDMIKETDGLLHRVIFEQKRPWRDLFLSNETFVTDALAKHYGLPVHGSDQPAWTSYAGTIRMGLFSQGSLLALGSRDAEPSPTLRGKAVRNYLLCQSIGGPPPGAKNDEPPVPPTPNACKSDAYKQHAAPGCAGCHDKMDPIGYGLENFDGHGKYLANEAGRTDCKIDGKGNVAGIGEFQGPGGLAELLTKSPELKACAVTQAYRFLAGRLELDTADGRAVDNLTKSREGDFRFDDLLVDMVSAPRFLYRRM